MPYVVRIEQTRNKQRLGPFRGNKGDTWTTDLAELAYRIPAPYDDSEDNLYDAIDDIRKRMLDGHVFAFTSLRQLGCVLWQKEVTKIMRRNKLRVYVYQVQEFYQLRGQCMFCKDSARKLTKIPFRVLENL